MKLLLVLSKETLKLSSQEDLVEAVRKGIVKPVVEWRRQTDCHLEHSFNDSRRGERNRRVR